MGCMTCAGDIASLVCSECRDWANDISERVHGKMVKDPRKRAAAMSSVLDFYHKRISQDEIEKRFKKLFGTEQVAALLENPPF